MQDAERQFAAENPVQISPDSQNRDCKQHETDPDADADHTVDIQYNIKAIAFITVNQTHFTKILSKRKISSGIKVPLLISFLHS